MRVLIVGAGLIGTSTAWYLRERGHEVTVIERDGGAGLQTSFANGAMLTPSMADPWNAPDAWRVLLASLFRSDAPLQIRLRVLPHLLRWGTRFLWNSRRDAFHRNTLSNLELARYSLDTLRELTSELALEYTQGYGGSLRIFREEASLQRAGQAATMLNAAGLRSTLLNSNELVSLESSLASIQDQLVGGIHYPDDRSGDAYRYCVALAEHSERAGVEFLFELDARAFVVERGRIAGLICGDRVLSADQYVIAAGSYSRTLLGRAGVKLPVEPAKGYSITFDRPFDLAELNIPVVDDHLHAAVVPIGALVRVAGTAEFAGFDTSLQPERLKNLTKLLTQVFPQASFDHSSARPWCGLRPMSADGVPIISRTHLGNLWVNTGHGHLGWTMATGSGALLTDLMCGCSPRIDAAPYAISRF